MIDWQPIETAPKDAKVLLYFPSYTIAKGAFKYDELFAMGALPLYGFTRQPTNWAHLEAPKTTNKPTAFGPNLLRIGREHT